MQGRPVVHEELSTEYYINSEVNPITCHNLGLVLDVHHDPINVHNN